MAKAGKGCGRSECGVSTSIDGDITFGTGKLDEFGFWEHPCTECVVQRYHPAEVQNVAFGSALAWMKQGKTVRRRKNRLRYRIDNDALGRKRFFCAHPLDKPYPSCGTVEGVSRYPLHPADPEWWDTFFSAEDLLAEDWEMYSVGT